MVLRRAKIPARRPIRLTRFGPPTKLSNLIPQESLPTETGHSRHMIEAFATSCAGIRNTAELKSAVIQY